MWTIDHPSLPDTAEPLGYDTLCVVDLGYDNPPLAVIDDQAEWRSPGVVQPWESATVTVTAPATSNQTLTLAVDEDDFIHTDVVYVNGQTLRPAAYPRSPQPGEFTWQRAELTEFDDDSASLPIVSITAYLPTAPNAPVVARIRGGKKRRLTIPTNYLAPNLLKVLQGLPITGKLSWTLSLEQHPSGGMELACVGKATAEKVMLRLRKGTEIELFGIGFAVSNIVKKIEPFQQYKISVSLSGKWARPKYNQPSFLRRDSWIKTVINADEQGQIDVFNARSTRPTKVAITSLAEQVGVPFFPRGDASWDVTITADTAKDASVVWSSGIPELARPNQGYIDWNQANGVYVRSINEGKRWRYALDSAEIGYQGDCENIEDDDYEGYAAEYANVELTGRFNEPRERPAQAKPTWNRRTPQIVTLYSGDVDPSAPSITAALPSGVNRLKTLSLNWDSSGPTATIRAVVTLDGQPFRNIEAIWGFCYQAKDVYNDDKEELDGAPSSYWTMVSYKDQFYTYSSTYGYELGHIVNGWRMARQKQETDDGLETLNLDTTDPFDAAEYDLYIFKRIPSVERSANLLQTYNYHYRDADEQPAWVSYTHTFRDGSTEPRFVKDPNWAPAMFVKESLTYSSSFAKARNPEYDPSEGYELPDFPPPPKYYITGEETLVRRSLYLKPGRKSIKRIQGTGKPDVINETVISPDLYTERVIEDSAQNSSFGDKAVRDTFTENEGRPSPASRRPALYEQEEPESNDAVQVTGGIDPSQYRHTITTPGYSADDPISSSIGYANARTVDQVETGATTDLYLRDVQESIRYSYPIPFNPKLNILDRITIDVEGETHATTAISITNNLTIEGIVDRKWLITHEPTQVEAGIDRTIPTERHSEFKPELEPGDSTIGGDEAQRDNPNTRLTLGTLFSTGIQNRGNY